jgi:hypothetical protein
MSKKKTNTDRKKYKDIPIEDRLLMVENLYTLPAQRESL